MTSDSCTTLASYAVHAKDSRGRLYKEPESATRSPYQRDRDRIIHSGAFRKLMGKTQVFVAHEGDYYRNRLTHSLEVAQLSRSIARELHLNEDLAEALALSHDLGHTPFGHAGEDAMISCMKSYGGFDHNAQSLRILTKLESRYAEFDGLNLTWETLEGVVKHNGPLTGKLPRAIKEYTAKHDLELKTYASLEAQITAFCDDIAYNNHDVEDGLRAGLFSLDDVKQVKLLRDVYETLEKKYKNIEPARLIHEARRRLIHRMCDDLSGEVKRRVKASGVETADDVRRAKKPMAGFSKEMLSHLEEIRTFLYGVMYKHYKVNRMTSKARRLVSDLFTFFLNEPECLPPDWFAKTSGPKTAKTAEVVADFIAGMTDSYAHEEYRRCFDISYKLLRN